MKNGNKSGNLMELELEKGRELSEELNDNEEPDESVLKLLESEMDNDADDDLDEAMSLQEDSDEYVDTIKTYFKEIGAIPILSLEEERQIGWRILSGNQAEEELETCSESEKKELEARIEDGIEAQKELASANCRLVIANAKKYSGLDLMDRIQEGNIGLLRAAKKYDVSTGYRFSTYATYWIRQAIQRAIYDKDCDIKLPVHVNESLSKYKRISNKLSVEYGRDATIAEIAVEMNMSEEKLYKLLQNVMDVCSLDSPINDDGEDTLVNIIKDDKTSTEDMGMNSVLRDNILSILEKFDDRGAEIIKLRYGFYGRVYTLEEVGKHFGLTRERIRQIESKVLRKIKNNSSMSCLLADFYYDLAS